MMPTERKLVLERVSAERDRQEEIFGHQTEAGRWAISPTEKLAVLSEEVGEVSKALCNGEANGVREELLQVAAVCVRWAEAFDDDPALDVEKAAVRDCRHLSERRATERQVTQCDRCSASVRCELTGIGVRVGLADVVLCHACMKSQLYGEETKRP